jgi:SAM-dependent methyltransferase
MWRDGSSYDSYLGRWSRRVAERFVPWLEVKRGADWVDVGCGTGVLTRAIVDLENPGAVVGVDPSASFLATADGSLHDERVRFVEGQAGALPLADASADVIVSGLVLNFVEDVGQALRDMRRVARPGGLIGAYVWDYAGEMQLLRLFWDAAVTIDPAALVLHEGVRFRICQPEALRATFGASGLADVEVASIDVPTHFESFDDYWGPFLGGVGAAPAYVASLPEPGLERLRERLEATVPREPDGSIELIARAWAVRGLT